jgi:hypothetical protein
MMLKALAIAPDGRPLLVIGLSFGNLDKFRREPGETFIRIDGQEMDMPLDVLIFSGETEAHMEKVVARGVTSQTRVHIDPKLKS